MILIDNLATCTFEQAQEFFDTFGALVCSRRDEPAYLHATENPDVRVAQLFLEAALARKDCKPNDRKLISQCALRNTNSQILEWLFERTVVVVDQPFLETVVQSASTRHIRSLVSCIQHQDTILLLQIALDHCRNDIVTQVLETGFVPNRIHVYLLFQLLPFWQYFVKNKIALTFRGREGSAVCHAIAKLTVDSPDLLAFAIQYGADAHAVDARGYSAFDYFCYRRRFGHGVAAVLRLAGVRLVPRERFFDELFDLSESRPYTPYFQVRFPRQLDDSVELEDLTPDELSDDAHHFVCAYADAIVRTACTQICIGLQSLDLPALLTCEILQAHCYMWPRIPFHSYWKLVTTVKHFQTPEHLMKKRRTTEE